MKSQLYNNEIITVLIYQVKTINKKDIKLNSEHIDYEYVDVFHGKDLIWYLKNK